MTRISSLKTSFAKTSTIENIVSSPLKLSSTKLRPTNLFRKPKFLIPSLVAFVGFCCANQVNAFQVSIATTATTAAPALPPAADAAAIAAVAAVAAVAEVETSKECSICFSEVTDPADPIQCGHHSHFCRECLQDSKTKSVNGSCCPLCRANIQTSSETCLRRAAEAGAAIIAAAAVAVPVSAFFQADMIVGGAAGVAVLTAAALIVVLPIPEVLF